MNSALNLFTRIRWDEFAEAFFGNEWSRFLSSSVWTLKWFLSSMPRVNRGLLLDLCVYVIKARHRFSIHWWVRFVVPFEMEFRLWKAVMIAVTGCFVVFFLPVWLLGSCLLHSTHGTWLVTSNSESVLDGLLSTCLRCCDSVTRLLSCSGNELEHDLQICRDGINFLLSYFWRHLYKMLKNISAEKKLWLWVTQN